mgnify:CR=1 FL=1
MIFWSELNEQEQSDVIKDMSLVFNEKDIEQKIEDVKRELLCAICWMSWYNCNCENDKI